MDSNSIRSRCRNRMEICRDNTAPIQCAQSTRMDRMALHLRKRRKRKDGYVCLLLCPIRFNLIFFFPFLLFVRSSNSSEVPSQKLSHVMPKQPRQIAKQIIPTRSHHYLPRHKGIHRRCRSNRMNHPA